MRTGGVACVASQRTGCGGRTIAASEPVVGGGPSPPALLGSDLQEGTVCRTWAVGCVARAVARAVFVWPMRPVWSLLVRPAGRAPRFRRRSYMNKKLANPEDLRHWTYVDDERLARLPSCLAQRTPRCWASVFNQYIFGLGEVSSVRHLLVRCAAGVGTAFSVLAKLLRTADSAELASVVNPVCPRS